MVPKQNGEPVGGQEEEGGTPLTGRGSVATCLRCGFPVQSRSWGCKNPCPNCGFVYPLGDCSD